MKTLILLTLILSGCVSVNKRDVQPEPSTTIVQPIVTHPRPDVILVP